MADPELRSTQSGVAVVSFRIACERDYKSKDPNAQNADFINIIAWRSTAEFISRYFAKGSMILVDGRIQTRDYTDNNGQRRYVTEVVAENVNFCGAKNEGGGNTWKSKNKETPTSYSGEQAHGKANDFQELPDDDDGELPF